MLAVTIYIANDKIFFINTMRSVSMLTSHTTFHWSINYPSSINNGYMMLIQPILYWKQCLFLHSQSSVVKNKFLRYHKP